MRLAPPSSPQSAEQVFHPPENTSWWPPPRQGVVLLDQILPMIRPNGYCGYVKSKASKAAAFRLYPFEMSTGALDRRLR